MNLDIFSKELLVSFKGPARKRNLCFLKSYNLYF